MVKAAIGLVYLMPLCAVALPWVQPSCASVVNARKTEFTISFIDGPDVQTSHACCINRRGVAAFSVKLTSSKYLRPATWNDGKLNVIKSFGNRNVSSRAINDKGELVGTIHEFVDARRGWTRAFIMRGKAFTVLEGLGGASDIANGINNNGLVVGASFDSGRVMQACTYSTGAARTLSKFAKGNATAAAVNQAGLVVGLDIGDGIVWRNGRAIKLSGSGMSEARCVNAKGDIAGSAEFTKDGPGLRMCLWRSGKPRDLGTLKGFSFCYALGINDSCDIVGGSERDKGASHAVLHRGNKMIDLSSVVSLPHGAVLEEAVGIDNYGRIVGNGTLGGKSVGFVLTPIKRRR